MRKALLIILSTLLTSLLIGCGDTIPSENDSTTEQSTTKEIIDGIEVDPYGYYSKSMKQSMFYFNIKQPSYIKLYYNHDAYLDITVETTFNDAYDGESIFDTYDPYNGIIIIPYDNDLISMIIWTRDECDWAFDIQPFVTSNTDSFSGTNSNVDVTGIFKNVSDKYEIKYTGDDNFYVEMYYEGEYFEETGYLSTVIASNNNNDGNTFTTTVSVEHINENAFFVIHGKGDWSITPVK